MSTPNSGSAATETPTAEDTEPAEGESAEETSAEGAEETAPEEETAEGEQAEAEGTEGEAPADGEKPPEGEEQPAETAKPLNELTVDELTTQLTEDQLQRVAQKYSNRTMAAARKAERAASEVRTQNEQLTATITTYKGFVDQLQANPMAALRRIPGWERLSFKQFAEIVAKDPADTEPAKIDPQVAELRARLDKKEREEAERNRAETHRNDVARVAEALGKEPDRFDLVLNDIGQAQLWDAINAYRTKYGRVPNEKVFEMADVVERRLEASLLKSKKFSPRPGAKAGMPTAGNGQAAGSRTAKTKTITNRASSGAPAIPDYSKLTEAERDKKILEDMRAAGEL